MATKLKLDKESRTKFKKALKKQIEVLQKTLDRELSGSIKQQIETDRSEIKDIGIIVCAFENSKSPFDFVRTEPLFYFKEKNFDVLLYGAGTIILIDVKESLVSDTLSKISNLKSYSEDVINNVEINNKIEKRNMPMIEYFETLTKNKISRKEFVLATQKAPVQEIVSRAKEVKFNFCLWKLLEKENKISILYEKIVGNDAQAFYDPNNTELKKYLKQLATQGEFYNDPLSFIFSSSSYLKAINISIPLFKKLKIFSYSDWCKLFNTDLINWHEEEKRIVYKNYIEYGTNCKFIKCVDDKGNLFINGYSIISRHSKTDALENDIRDKVIKQEVGKRIESNIPDMRKRLENDFLTKQAEETGQNLLTNFFGNT